MLIYHPAFDAYHCVFRIIAILDSESDLEIDKLRILDFCLCFPSIVESFRLTSKTRVIKRAAAALKNPYRTPLNPKSTFLGLSSAQDSALACLSAAHFVDPKPLRAGVARRGTAILPSSINERCAQMRIREQVFFEKILPALSEIDLLGPDGLKARSGLTEYRYDSVA